MKVVLTSMLALGAAVAVAAAASASPGPAGGVAVRPSGGGAVSVRIVKRVPLTLHIARRETGERIRVLVTVQGRTFARVLVARRDGIAVLRLSDVVLRHCQPVYVRLGGAPRRLQVVRWPSLDCPPTG